MTVTNTAPQLTLDQAKKLGIDNITPEQATCTVFVSNLSTAATLKSVQDFFSFSGNVNRAVIDTDGDKQFAVVVFDEEGAANTALLMSNAVIADSPITVQPYIPPVHTASAAEASSSASTSAAPKHKSSRSATSVVAALIAGGYIAGENVINEIKSKAEIFDNKTHISDKAKTLSQDIDQKLHLTAAANTIAVGATTISKKIDDSLQIQDKINKASAAANALGTKIMANSVVNSGWNFLNWGFESVRSIVTVVESEAKEQIARHKGIDPQQAQAQAQQQQGVDANNNNNNNNSNDLLVTSEPAANSATPPSDIALVSTETNNKDVQSATQQESAPLLYPTASLDNTNQQ